MSDSYQKLGELIEFPALIGLRVIVDAHDNFALDKVKGLIDNIEPNSLKEITDPSRKSSNGNYISHTVPVLVKSKEHLKKLYVKISALDCVKHVI